MIPLTQDMRADSSADWKIVYLDHETHEIRFPEQQGISNDGYLWAILDQIDETYTVVNNTVLDAVFNEEFNGSLRSGAGIDAVLAIDSSGSMSSSDPNDLRITAAKLLINGLIQGTDQAAVVDFDEGATLLHALDFNLNAALVALDFIDSSGGTNITNAVTLAIEQLIQSTTGNTPLIVLLTDGRGNYDTTLSMQAKNAGIVIYTIGLGDGVDEELLREIAAAINGSYFKVDSAEQLIAIFDKIRKETEDSDNDGLSDYAELNGMRSWYGYSILTDPYNPDTDGDGLSDGQEMGSISNTKFGYPKYNMVSNPLLVDSDGDEISDYNEVYPSEGKVATNPLKADTDNDGLKDNVDSYPREWDWYGTALRPGDIILVGHNENYERAENWGILERYTMGTWSHAAIYAGDEETIDSHPNNPNGSTNPEEPNGGVDYSEIHEFLHPNKCVDDGYCAYDRIVFLRIESKDDESSARAVDKAKEYLGQDFDFPEFEELVGGIGGIGERANEVYCAELVYLSWKSEGIDLKPAWSMFPWVTPKNIYHDWKTKIIKEMDPMSGSRP